MILTTDMASSLRIDFLGTGTSVGVPQIGCTCEVCQSPDPKNKRLRSSVVISSPTTTLLVDVGPDHRTQSLRAGLTHVDAVLVTHAHADHIAGFDDLRAYCWHKPDDFKLPIYGYPSALEALQKMFSWAFKNQPHRYVRPIAYPVVNSFRVGDIYITPFTVWHARRTHTLGYLFEYAGVSIAYACDMKAVPPESMRILHGVDLLVLDGLRWREHSTHSTVDNTIQIMHQAAAKRGLITHTGHELDYAQLRDYLAATSPSLPIEPAFDTLSITLTHAKP